MTEVTQPIVPCSYSLSSGSDGTRKFHDKSAGHFGGCSLIEVGQQGRSGGRFTGFSVVGRYSSLGA